MFSRFSKGCLPIPKVDTLRVLGAKAMLDSGKHSVSDVAAELKISRATLYRSLATAQAAA